MCTHTLGVDSCNVTLANMPEVGQSEVIVSDPEWDGTFGFWSVNNTSLLKTFTDNMQWVQCHPAGLAGVGCS